MGQMSLLQKEDNTFKGGEEVTKDKIDADYSCKYPIEYCLNKIKGEVCLWDMRCWDKYHNREG